MSGYVVRGMYEGADVYSYGATDGFGTGAPEISPRCIWDLDTAAGCRAFMVRRGCTDVRIFAVAEDGTETPLPTYEEALASIALIRAEVELALAHHARPGGMSCGPPDLAGCAPSALRAILRMLGGAS